MPKFDLKRIIDDIGKIYEKYAPTGLQKKVKYLGNKDYTDKVKLYARGMKLSSGQKHTSFDAEATVYVWHEKNVLQLPKWLVGTTFNTGHAAMRITNLDLITNKQEVVRYMSWWPGSGADKNTPSQSGQLVKSFTQDRTSEMGSGGGDDIMFFLKLKLIGQAIRSTENGEEEFKQLREKIWAVLSDDERQHYLGKYNIGENFDNLDSIKDVRLQDNQKLLSTKKIKDSPKHPGRNAVPTKGYKDLTNDDVATIFDDLMVVKQPYCKVYIPCSSQPVPLYVYERYQHSTVWGLSTHAMELASRIYDIPGTEYVMKSYSNNCIGAVWTVLKAGFADVISDGFKSTKGPVNNFAHYKSLVPSDAINASLAVMDDVVTRMAQQALLDSQAQMYKEELFKIARNNKCFERGWRMYVLNAVWWRDFSEAPGLRPEKKKKVDDLVLVFSKLCNNTGGEENKEIPELWGVMKFWDDKIQPGLDTYRQQGVDAAKQRKDFAACTQRISELQEAIDRFNGFWDEATVDGKEILRTDGNIKWLHEQLVAEEKRRKSITDTFEGIKKMATQLKSHLQPFAKQWEEKLLAFEKKRRDQARVLVDLHDAIFDYIYSSNRPFGFTPDKRYLAALLLGQFVAWMYAELANPNLEIGFHGLNEVGFIVTNSEKDKRLRLK